MKDVGENLFKELVSSFTARSSPVESLCIYSLWPIVGLACRRFSDPIRYQNISKSYPFSSAYPSQTIAKISLKSTAIP
jgi:hypothetical protein